jgi:hypothetical protein
MIPVFAGREGFAVFSYRYRIVVSGRLSEMARDAFEEFRIDRVGDDTALIAELDQAALFGVVARINLLGLELVELVRLFVG